MKKALLLFIIGTAQVIAATAQSKGKSYLSLHAGPSFATGKFASTNDIDPLAGFAKTGGNISLSYSNYFSRYIGIAVELKGQRNPINTKAFENSLAEIYPDYPNWKFEKKSWMCAALLAGATAQFAIDKSNKLNLTIRAMSGAVYVKSPGLTGSSNSPAKNASVEQNKKSQIGFTYSFATGLNYSISKSMFFSLAVEYAGTPTITFKNIKTTTTTSQGTFGTPDYSIQQSVSTVSSRQPIGSVNVLVGVGIKL